MKLMIRIILIFFTASFAVNASSYQGKITSVFAYDGNIYIFVGNGAYDIGHTCGDESATFRIDQKTSYGRSLLAMALAAKATQGIVWAAGDDSCVLGGPRTKYETLTTLDLKW